eukprot:scaffold1915_cov288-Prasinococcus_capsulatus_cf.AAC.14
MTEATHQMASACGDPTSQAVRPSPWRGSLCCAKVRALAHRHAGYEHNPEANAKAFAGGWLHTGDQGYLDEEGYLFLTGRLKELINRGGEKVRALRAGSFRLR